MLSASILNGFLRADWFIHLQRGPAEPNWSGSTLFDIKYVNLYQQSGSNTLIGWKLEVGMAS